MTKRAVRPLSSFQWASVTRFIVYIAAMADLREVNANHVNSCPLSRMGPHKVVARKTRVLALIRENLQKLEGFVGRRRNELGEAELSVIRAMYRQYKRDVETVEDHLAIAEEYNAVSQGQMEDTSGGANDDLPF